MSSEKKKWIITTKRFVAFLDIMGFKDMVARNSHKNIYNSLHAITSDVKQGKWHMDSYISIFSDSIVIFSRDQTQKSFHDLIWSVLIIFTRFLLLDIPLKGCLSFGTLTVDREKQIFFGQPLIDAYLLEEDLLYFGVILHHSAEKEICSWYSQMPYFLEIPTKLKSGTSNHLNLIWPSAYEIISSDLCPTGYCLDPLEVMRNLKFIMSGAPRRYLDNTIEVIEEIKKRNAPLYKYIDSDNSTQESQ